MDYNERNKTELSGRGYTILRGFFNEDYMSELGNAMNKSYELCRNIQIKNGIDAVTDGTVHHLLATGDFIYLDLIDKINKSEVFDFMKFFFKGNFILNTYGGVLNLPSKSSYVANIHRDIRFFSDSFPLMLNFLVMLDDFTLENGATYLLPESHKKGDKPTENEFYAKADRAIGKRGDILFFNSNLWHAAGINNTKEIRKAITIAFTKPFMKQQMDYPRLIGYEKLSKMTEELKQVIGYYSRVCTNLDEWYQKPENRFYRPGQD